METIKNYVTMKTELKQQAEVLRTTKEAIKAMQKEQGSGAACYQQFKILSQKSDYRHKHIAYSMMRGRTYDQIEPKCAQDNKPDFEKIQKLIAEYTHENVCTRTE